jgi:hypothetical protein
VEIEETQGLWPADADPDQTWYLKLTWAPIDGRMECVGVELRSARLPGDQEPAGSLLRGRKWRVEPKPLTSALLRELPIGELIAMTRQGRIDWWQRGMPELVRLKKQLGAESRQELDRLRATAEAKAMVWRRPGRRGPSPAELRDVAETYRAALEDGQPPKRAVMARLELAESTADRWIAWAREGGYLTVPARRGRPRK